MLPSSGLQRSLHTFTGGSLPLAYTKEHSDVLLNAFIFFTEGEKNEKQFWDGGYCFPEDKYIYFRSRVELEARTELALLGKMTCMFQSGLLII